MPELAARFLLTGPLRTRKTTQIERLSRELQAARIALGGFIAREVREHEERTGFRVGDFTGRRAMMAHVAWIAGCPVSRYRVDVAAFDSIAIPAIEQALSTARVIILDETGPMELCSRALTRSGRPFHGEVMAPAAVMRRGSARIA